MDFNNVFVVTSIQPEDYDYTVCEFFTTLEEAKKFARNKMLDFVDEGVGAIAPIELIIAKYVSSIKCVTEPVMIEYQDNNILSK